MCVCVRVCLPRIQLSPARILRAAKAGTRGRHRRGKRAGQGKGVRLMRILITTGGGRGVVGRPEPTVASSVERRCWHRHFYQIENLSDFIIPDYEQ